MGPFPSSLDEMTTMMVGKKEITIQQVVEREGYSPTEVYHCLVQPEDAGLEDDEKKMLDRNVSKYGNLNGKQLEELSHAEAPYIGTALKEEIPYELAFYRGTDFAGI